MIGYYAWAPIVTGDTSGNGGAQYIPMIVNGGPYKINYIRITCGVNNDGPPSYSGHTPFGYSNGKAVLANQVALPNTVNWDPVFWSGLIDI